MIAFSRRLDILLEHETASPTTPAQEASQLSKQLQEAKQKVIDLQKQLSSLIDRINSDFAISIRKRHPSLNVAIDKKQCKVGYKSKSLTLTPNIEEYKWIIDSPNRDFIYRFIQLHGTNFSLDDNSLVDTVAKHFIAHYKTLGEDAENGALLIDGKPATLLDLASRKATTFRLKTRLSR